MTSHIKSRTEIETYIESQRKAGFSCAQIVKKLKDAGYTDAFALLAEKVYHYRKRTRILLSVIFILVIILIVVAGLSLRSQQTLTIQETYAVTPTNDPLPCLDLPTQQEQHQCLSRVEATLRALVNRKILITDPRYPAYAREVSLLAAITQDKDVCEKLQTTWIPGCEGSLPYLHARVEGDPSLCSQVTDLSLQEDCVVHIMGQTSTYLVKGINEQLENATSRSISLNLTTSCQSLPYPYLIRRCEVNTHIGLAVTNHDSTYCTDLADSHDRESCIASISRV